ncbi:hypothetical protein COEREDRAFT_12797 [Coemansia reversa NRRL 1564]|uniref:Uncharacterized protein n=1 Tax=Coemansia reversa (strain ATCC 12441 / NRRL 1564) TaxID=763665 RepID=A0A2G5B0A3_COERN|nr:hypothetical protein COEREDRAFT_12797 [Coemansia reversa NRRL 1564]|eukprot:PIA12468.1 hypothetical protein COEREDRAFT_12797 [Coemansia reversa NRRL 1564]
MRITRPPAYPSSLHYAAPQGRLTSIYHAAPSAHPSSSHSAAPSARPTSLHGAASSARTLPVRNDVPIADPPTTHTPTPTPHHPANAARIQQRNTVTAPSRQRNISRSSHLQRQPRPIPAPDRTPTVDSAPVAAPTSPPPGASQTGPTAQSRSQRAAAHVQHATCTRDIPNLELFCQNVNHLKICEDGFSVYNKQ